MAGIERNIHPLTPSWSSTILFPFPPSTMIHIILSVQFTCSIVFLHNISPNSLWSTSWLEPSTSYSIHVFTHSLFSFHNKCPYHHNLFSGSTKIVSSIPSTSLISLLGTLSCTLMSHIHLTILISAHWSATSLSFFTCHFTHNCCRVSLS